MTCPRCGAKLVPVLYGLPHFPDDPELDRAIAAGADHRGCVIPPGPMPVELCRSCGLELDSEGTPIPEQP